MPPTSHIKGILLCDPPKFGPLPLWPNPPPQPSPSCKHLNRASFSTSHRKLPFYPSHSQSVFLAVGRGAPAAFKQYRKRRGSVTPTSLSHVGCMWKCAFDVQRRRHLWQKLKPTLKGSSLTGPTKLIKTEWKPDMKTERRNTGGWGYSGCEAVTLRNFPRHFHKIPLDCIWALKCQHEEQQTQWPLTCQAHMGSIQRWGPKNRSRVSGGHLFLDCLCLSLQNPDACIPSQIVWSKCHALKQQRGQISQTLTKQSV